MEYALQSFTNHKEFISRTEDVSLILCSLLCLLDLSQRRYNEPSTTNKHKNVVCDSIEMTMDRVGMLLTANPTELDCILPLLSSETKCIQ